MIFIVKSSYSRYFLGVGTATRIGQTARENTLGFTAKTAVVSKTKTRVSGRGRGRRIFFSFLHNQKLAT